MTMCKAVSLEYRNVMDRPTDGGTDAWTELLYNKNLAIANRSRVSCAHNTLRASIGLNITL